MKGKKPLRVTDCSSIEHACPRVAYVKTSNDITSSFLAGNSRDFRIHQRDGDKNAKKENTLTSKTTTLLMHHTCLYSSLPFLHNYAWQCQILHFMENVNKH